MSTDNSDSSTPSFKPLTAVESDSIKSVPLKSGFRNEYSNIELNDLAPSLQQSPPTTAAVNPMQLKKNAFDKISTVFLLFKAGVQCQLFPKEETPNVIL